MHAAFYLRSSAVKNLFLAPFLSALAPLREINLFGTDIAFAKSFFLLSISKSP
jgi:hypothetical protein